MIAGPMLREPKGIRRLEDFYMATAADPEIIQEIFEKETEIGIQNLKKMHDAIGDSIDVLHICGTDLGTQKSLFYSKSTIQEVWAPYWKKINDWVHENTGWKTFKHCCGSIAPIIDVLIDSGFDILNPVQWTADNMDRNMLKRKFRQPSGILGRRGGYPASSSGRNSGTGVWPGQGMPADLQ